MGSTHHVGGAGGLVQPAGGRDVGTFGHEVESVTAGRDGPVSLHGLGPRPTPEVQVLVVAGDVGIGALGARWKILDGITDGDLRDLPLAARTVCGRGRPGQLPVDIADGNQDAPPTPLWHAVVGRVEHAVGGRVGGQLGVVVQQVKQLGELGRLLKLGHVLDDEGLGLQGADSVEVVLPQAVERCP